LNVMEVKQHYSNAVIMNGLFIHNCVHHEDAGVRCRKKERWLIQNLSVDIDSIDAHTVLITWMLQNDTLHWPDSYVIECFSEDEGHRIEMSASNSTFSIQLMGLIPSTPYNCCVSALPALHELYVYKRTCTDEVIMIQMTEHTQRAPDL
jgi:hypothetical protein